MKVAALLVVVWCAGAMMCTSAAQPAGGESGASHRYCGRILSDMWALVCAGEAANAVKRSEGQLHYGHEPSYGGLQWLLPRAAFTAVQARGKRQIVDECCNKPCSIDELMTYC